MELLLKRFSTGAESTLGTMHRRDEIVGRDPPSFRCFTLEDRPNEPKVSRETRIPAGRYRIEFRTEGGMTKRYAKRFPWHQGMLWLRDIPDFTFVYIHVGNDDEDTEGCILVGDGVQSNVLDDGMVTSSVAAYTRLYAEIVAALTAGEDVILTVEDYA